MLRDRAYGSLPLSEKTRKSNHLQMSLQRKQLLLSYLKALIVGPAGIWSHNRLQSSLMLNWLSQQIADKERLHWFLICITVALVLNCCIIEIEPTKNTFFFPLFLKHCCKKTKGMRHFEITFGKPSNLTQLIKNSCFPM